MYVQQPKGINNTNFNHDTRTHVYARFHWYTFIRLGTQNLDAASQISPGVKPMNQTGSYNANYRSYDGRMVIVTFY